MIPNLLRGSSGCGIGDGPGCLFPCTELCFLKNFNQHREDVCIYDSLRENWGGDEEEKVSHFKKRNQIQPTNQLRFRPLPFLGVFLCSCYVDERLWGNLTSTIQNLWPQYLKGNKILLEANNLQPLMSPCLPTWHTHPDIPPVCSTCIWALLPAVIFEIVQQASFRIDSLGLLSKWRRQGSAEQLRMT